MISFAAQTRLLTATSVPAPSGELPRQPGALPAPAPCPPADVQLRPGNLVEVGASLGAQMFSVVDGEVTFTARSADCVRRWRGRLDSCGLVEL
jgi:hypothetical protein